MAQLPQGVEITADITPAFADILTPEALAFVARLHRQFESRRRELMAARDIRQSELDAGRLRDEGRRARGARVHFEHVDHAVLDGELDVHQADDVERKRHASRLPADLVLQLPAQAARRQ